MKGATSPCRMLIMGIQIIGSRSMGIFPRSPAMHLMLATRICLGAATRCRSAAGCLQRVLLMGCASGDANTVLAGGPRAGTRSESNLVTTRKQDRPSSGLDIQAAMMRPSKRDTCRTVVTAAAGVAMLPSISRCEPHALHCLGSGPASLPGSPHAPQRHAACRGSPGSSSLPRRMLPCWWARGGSSPLSRRPRCRRQASQEGFCRRMGRCRRPLGRPLSRGLTGCPRRATAHRQVSPAQPA